MEILMNNTALTVLAADVTAKLTAIHADLAELAEITKSVADTAEEAYYADSANREIPFCMVSGDYWLAKALADSIEGIREKIIHPRAEWSGAVRDIAKKIESREFEYSRAEKEIAEKAAARALSANREAAKTAERVESGFQLIETFTKVVGKGKSKEHIAHVLFKLDGELYQEYATYDPKSGEIPRDPNWIGVRLMDIDKKSVDLFKAEMTVEEIGKAAHVQDSIRAALRAEVGPLKAAA